MFHHLTLTTLALLSTRKIMILSRRGPAENPNQATISQLCWASHNTYRCAKREETKWCGKKPQSPDSASQQKWSSCEAQKCFDHGVDVVITVCKWERWKQFQMFLASLKMTLITLFSFQFLCYWKLSLSWRHRKLHNVFWRGFFGVYCLLYFSINRALLFQVNSLGNSPWFTYKGKVDGH